ILIATNNEIIFSFWHECAGLSPIQTSVLSNEQGPSLKSQWVL
ncbi:28575_t:CDS:2, partial [Dentiscutata erythropus]